jgi:hypothetical protein
MASGQFGQSKRLHEHQKRTSSHRRRSSVETGHEGTPTVNDRDVQSAFRRVDDTFRRIQGAFQQVDRNHSELASAQSKLHDQLQRQLAEQQQRAAIEAAVEVAARAYGHAASYTNALILAGYVTFFGLWNLTKGLVPSAAQAATALLLTFSATVFVAWHVYLLVEQSLAFRRMGAVGDGDPAKFRQAIADLQRREHTTAVRRLRAWGTVVIACATTALAAVCILAYYFLKPLVGTACAAIMRIIP